MSQPERGSDPLPPGLIRRLDPVCDRFETEWLAGRRPRPEDFLSQVAGPDRPALLRELLALDLDYRARHGEQPTAQEYHSRLPEYAAVIEAVFAGPTTPGIPPVGSTPPPTGTEAQAPSRPPAGPETPLARVGRYEIEGEIARGGMGLVLRARDPDLKRILAVKVLLETHCGNEDLERRFREEAQLTGQLQHPGIPPVHEVGTLDDGRPFFTMKLIKGRTLAEVLEGRGTADLPLLLGIFKQVCQTLAYAHSKGVIHRDLKPSNVMVGAFDEVQVMDWGLAKMLDHQRPAPRKDSDKTSAITPVRTAAPGQGSQRGLVLGTPAYMAPEQARGEVDEVDERADVFGLGAILCEVLTGQPPYAGSAVPVLYRAMLGDLGQALERLNGCGADPELVSLARSCLGSRPEERLPHGQAVAEAVSAYLNGVQEKLRRAELDRAAAALRAVEERKRRRLTATLAAVGLAAMLLLGLCWRWVEQAHDASRAQTAVQVNHELGRATSLRDQALALHLDDPGERRESARLWDEALDAARKAEDDLAAGLAGPGTQQLVAEKVRALRAEADADARDRAMVEKLEEARERRAAIADEDVDRTNPRAVIVFGHGAAESYATAFRDYDIDVLALEPKEAARRIRERPRIRDRLVDALDDWLVLDVDQPAAGRLLAISREADPDAFRNRLRAAVAAVDREALEQLAGEAAARKLPVRAALLLADGLHLAGKLGEAVALLRRTQQDYPGDFWVNDVLGVYLTAWDPSRADEAGRCFAAALALRPDSYFAYDNLALTLIWQCRWVEAVAACQTAEGIAKRLGRDFLKVQFALAAALAGQGENDKATAICRDVVRRRPGFLFARVELMRQLAGAGDTAAALDLARETLERSKDRPLAHLGLAEALFLNGKAKEAVAAYEEALRLGGSPGAIHLGLGYAYLAQDQCTEARQHFEEARARDPHRPEVHFGMSALYSQEHCWEEAVAACRRAVALRPAFWQCQMNLGGILFQAGVVDEAGTAYREAVRLNPKAEDAHNGLGNVLYWKGQWDLAVAEYEEALRLRPTGVVWRNLGNTHLKKGRPEEALAAFRKACDLEPDNAAFRAACRDAQGLVLLGRKEPGQAIDAFRAAVEAADGNATYWMHLGWAYWQNKEDRKQTEAYREAIRRAAKDAFLLGDLGRDLVQQQAFEEAIGVLRRAIDVNRKYPFGLNQLGLALQGAGRYDEAIAAFRQVLALEPGNVSFLDNLGVALTWSGRWQEAVAVLQQAVGASERFEAAWFHLGTALRFAGRFREGQAAFEKAQALNRERGGSAGPLPAAIRLCARLAALESQRPAILEGKVRPATSEECFDLALFCFWNRHPIPAVTYFTRGLEEAESENAATQAATAWALAAQSRGGPCPAGDPASYLLGVAEWAVAGRVRTAAQQGYRFSAALTAIEAAGEADGDEPARLRRQALAWLRAEVLDRAGAEKTLADRAPLRRELLRWQNHAGLAGVRDRAALANLPAGERRQWQQFWADADAFVRDEGKDR
jgi:tetratricopeptide (TPR) repeat protein